MLTTNSTISSLLRARALEQPNAPAILAPGRSGLTFAQLWEQTQELAGGLASLGVSRATRVAVVMPNGPEAATAFLGVAAVRNLRAAESGQPDLGAPVLSRGHPGPGAGGAQG